MPKRPIYKEVNGFRLPIVFATEAFHSAESYVPDDDEVIVATYPKCGTTWVQQIVYLILRKGQPTESSEEYFKALPFLEMFGKEGVQRMSRPGCVKTHLPVDRLNLSPTAKYIYVARNPSDCAVSFYHHTRFFPIYYFSDGGFDNFFELFVKGEVDFNDYFDHLLPWYAKRHEDNVLFTTYEAIKADTRKSVLDIARFLGEDHYQTLLADDCDVLDKVIRYSSVEYMKATVNEYWKQIYTADPENLPDSDYARNLKDARSKGHSCVGDFVRKGEVGEGKIVLSLEQRKKLESRITEKGADACVAELWGNL